MLEDMFKWLNLNVSIVCCGVRFLQEIQGEKPNSLGNNPPLSHRSSPGAGTGVLEPESVSFWAPLCSYRFS